MRYPVYTVALTEAVVDMFGPELAAYRNRPGIYLKAITKNKDGSQDYVFTCKTGKEKFLAWGQELMNKLGKVA